jgi:predicted pyridoxine 5'-phosphate oxidase superfamily flavin-nucleotide-binding protein
MPSRFHAGELAVQERARGRERAARVGGSIHGTVPPAAKAFLEQRRFVVLATADAEGRPWASILTGSPGFATVPDPVEVRIDAAPLPGDPLADNLPTSAFAGLLAIDLATRRRMRVNGRLEHTAGRPITIRVDQVYSNCPKYIQRRAVEQGMPREEPRLARRAASLTEAQRDWIRRADTFFIATLHPEHGADASHRGGMPGFVRVEGEKLVWPDYAGNLMYNTLGNIAAYPRAGLIVPDFDSGAVLQLTGGAAIEWDAVRSADVPGAERLVELVVDEVVEIAGTVLPSAQVLDYSPFNPPPGDPGPASRSLPAPRSRRSASPDRSPRHP